jgi:hypothetical protein
MKKEIKFEEVWSEISRKLENKEFRYGQFPPKHAVNISDIKATLRPIIKKILTTINP